MQRPIRYSRRRSLRGVLLVCAVILSIHSAAEAQTQAEKEIERLNRAARTAEEQGNREDAIKAYGAIILLADNSSRTAATAQLGIGNNYMAMGKYPEALAAFQRSVALDAGSAEALNNLGEALGELKRYPEAIEAFQRAVAADAGFLKPRYNMGVTYERMGQLKYAEFVYRLLVRDHPDFALGYDCLAVVLSKSARSREAIPLHEKAISLDASEPSFYYNFGVSYALLGEMEKAREQQQKLAGLDAKLAEQLAQVIAKHRK